MLTNTWKRRLRVLYKPDFIMEQYGRKSEVINYFWCTCFISNVSINYKTVYGIYRNVFLFCLKEIRIYILVWKKIGVTWHIFFYKNFSPRILRVSERVYAINGNVHLWLNVNEALIWDRGWKSVLLDNFYWTLIVNHRQTGRETLKLENNA
jgi:hypothetical protein